MLRLFLVGLALAFSMRATASHAQDTSVVAQSDSALCEGRRITRIDLESGVRTVEEGVPGIVRPIARLAVGGPRTRERALLPYLLVKEGSVCSEARRRESERLLRGLKYVASARLRPEVDGDGVRIVVEATDDLRPIVGMTLDDNTPESIKLGTVNLAGTGTLVHGEWKDGGPFRDVFGVRASNPTLFGRRATWLVSMDRLPIGDRTILALSEPYLTRFQAIAWEVSLRDETQYIPLSLNTADRAVWRTNWRTLNAGALSRISLGNAQLLAGGLFTHERIAPADSGVLLTPDGLVESADPALADRYVTQSGSRIGVIGGIRALSFMTAEGLQTVEGIHDVARGIQAAAVVGRGVSGGDDHPFIATEVYAGAGGPRSFATARVTAERRRSGAQRAARLASGRVAWYWRVSERQTQEISAEFSGIWREDVPAAMFLDDRLSGPRGFDGAVASGTRLLVGRFERRLNFGGFGRSVGFAGAAFGDAAKLWSGDAPLGVTTDPLFSAGVGFLVALPRNSRKTIRLDASYPISKSNGAGGFDIRMTVTNAGRTYWQEPAAFQRSRIVPMLRSLLGWF